ncbi:MAG: preprotein translocase subunit SecG [Candidatus Magasanikbacteria bacterium RIFCSPHIGHO2_01_FULL_50_8]|uniref:Protein-export membrane protein SecG n=2 Tax=Candidatus Magasanikiibacteriota TaxID=1752731 RepID=A0A1F6LUB1_9BACT|nr:MAG: preprotein translocase subunit SecG [Candidatus Magasanikbacteria bacterium RIFCSPHIGHO2_01_FULL_50_8]OGH68183.1 MAG: preprotein translocase subunit SecG [Candidatus Magasanikbacteria bacterium RIFCSPHIGHO2_02_FULL_50_9b]
MQTTLNIIQIVISILLITVVLLQQKGVGLGAAFGGSSNVYSTKRGVDKILFRATIVLAVLFIATAATNLLIQ